MARLTCEKLHGMIHDELEGGAEYHKFGLHKLADDEFRHAKTLKKIYKKRCK